MEPGTAQHRTSLGRERRQGQGDRAGEDEGSLAAGHVAYSPITARVIDLAFAGGLKVKVPAGKVTWVFQVRSAR